jgi:hypothetical protein
MKVTKQTKQVERIVVEEENVYTLELTEKQAAMLYILCGQIIPATADAIIKEGLGTYHKALNKVVGDMDHGSTNVNLIGPIYDNLKEFFHNSVRH